MFERFTRSARIGAAYANVFGEVVALEAREEVHRLVARLIKQAAAAGLLLLGVAWLNLGVFVLIWHSPYRQWLPLAIGAGLMLIAVLIWATSKRDTSKPAFAAVREAVAEDALLWGIDLDPERVLHEPARDPVTGRPVVESPSKPSQSSDDASLPKKKPDLAQLQAQLRALRIGLRRSVVGDVPKVSARADSGSQTGSGGRRRLFADFAPKSRTMRTLMAVVGSGTAGDLARQLPIKAVLGLAIGAAMRGRARWLVTLWPILRLISAELAHNRQGARRTSPRSASHRPVGPASRDDAGMDYSATTAAPTRSVGGDK